MTEHKWLTSVKPLKMLDWLTSEGIKRVPPQNTRDGRLASDRRLRLFACACCRQSWHLLTDERSRRAVEVAERYADGMATINDLDAACDQARLAGCPGEVTFAPFHLCAGELHFALFLARNWTRESRDSHPHLLRSIVGNPFRPLLRTSTHIYQTYGVNVVWRFRVTHSAVALATVAYEQRMETTCERCDGRGGRWDSESIDQWYSCGDCHGTGKLSAGQLDPHNLSILADALEDAGCDNDDVLSGLRSPEPRYRGWHVLDVILGKE